MSHFKPLQKPGNCLKAHKNLPKPPLQCIFSIFIKYYSKRQFYLTLCGIWQIAFSCIFSYCKDFGGGISHPKCVPMRSTSANIVCDCPYFPNYKCWTHLKFFIYKHKKKHRGIALFHIFRVLEGVSP